MDLFFEKLAKCLLCFEPKAEEHYFCLDTTINNDYTVCHDGCIISQYNALNYQPTDTDSFTLEFIHL